jgi:hypothetical protein
MPRNKRNGTREAGEGIQRTNLPDHLRDLLLAQEEKARGEDGLEELGLDAPVETRGAFLLEDGEEGGGDRGIGVGV